MAVSGTSFAPGNLVALRGGFRSKTVRDAIAAEVGRELDAAGITGVHRRALHDAMVTMRHLRVATEYLSTAGLLRSKARPRAIALTAVEFAGLARRQLVLVPPSDAQPILVALEQLLTGYAAQLEEAGSPIRERAAPWKVLYVHLADELVRIRSALIADRRGGHRGIDAAARAQAAAEAHAELQRRYGRDGDAP
jgi:hypothetical protein